ncbi:hypothetical protein JCM1841_000133 [Sporobolomyces salmonicolor]
MSPPTPSDFPPSHLDRPARAPRPAPVSAFSTDSTLRSMHRRGSADSASSFGSTSSRPGETAQAPVKTITLRATPLPPSPGQLCRPLGVDETLVLSTLVVSGWQADKRRTFSSGGFNLDADAASASLLVLEAYEREEGFPWFSGGTSEVKREVDLGNTAEDGRAREIEPEVREREGSTPLTSPSPSIHHPTSSPSSPEFRSSSTATPRSDIVQPATPPGVGKLAGVKRGLRRRTRSRSAPARTSRSKTD